MERKCKIAVIDDDEIFHVILERQLESINADFELLKFHNGQEAIDFLSGRIDQFDSIPDLVFLDLNMPIKNGWEFIEEYSQLPEGFKGGVDLYMLTSSVIKADVDRAKNHTDILDFVSKPMSSNTLLDIINYCNRKYRLEDSLIIN